MIKSILFLIFMTYVLVGNLYGMPPQKNGKSINTNELKMLKGITSDVESNIKSSGTEEERDFKFAMYKGYKITQNSSGNFLINVSFYNISDYTKFGKRMILKDVAVSFMYVLGQIKENCFINQMSNVIEKAKCYRKIKSYISPKYFIFKTDNVKIKGNNINDFFINADDMNKIKHLKASRGQYGGEYFLNW